MTPETARQVTEASNPKTPPARLRVIAETASLSALEQIRREFAAGPIYAALAANPNTPPDILLPLAVGFPEEFARNPVLPLLPLEMPDIIERLEQYESGVLG